MLDNFKIGDFGHLFVIVSFIASAIAALAYWRNSVLAGTPGVPEQESLSWKRFARGAFMVHAAAVTGVVATLFLIIYHHHYEYYYAWDHSSNDLPAHYMISCFWEGQEGSFLLWIFWHVLLGLILIKVNKTWEAPMMTIFCLVQAFLASMILGIAFPSVGLKIGSSPFILFKEQMGNLPVFQMNPDYVPKDGSGLNALLQNYWMVIHPPTLFLGFAATLVPFAYCVAGLWQKKYKEWVRPALPWALFAALVLGTGILMGGYWAYETLNFGGYWNWDPVENAVLVPWLVLVGSIHTMIAYRNSEKALKASVILVVATFILILFSTFLTRSGILGEASVHSFTDLGLSGQLLVYLAAFTLLSVVLMVRSWKEIPTTEEEANIYSREFWIFIGITVLCLASFQILTTTSLPVYNKILAAVGIDKKFAPPAKPVEHYSNWQLWFAVAIAILCGLGQFFWWKKMDSKKLWNIIAIPVIVTLLAASGIIFLAEIRSVKYILLITSSVFAVVANLTILFPLLKGNIRLSGGAVSHIGIGMMLLGILFSSGYSTIISKNMTGQKIFKDNKENEENVTLSRGVPTEMGEYLLTYEGSYWEAKDFPGYVSTDNLILLDEKSRQMILTSPLVYNDKVYYQTGDTITVNPQNNYYRIHFRSKTGGEEFTLYPRVQKNDQMGYVVSPDIRRFLGKDLYSHLSYSSDLEEKEKEWTEPEEVSAKIKDTLFLNDHVAILDSLVPVKKYPGVKITEDQGVIKAVIRILGKDKVYYAEPALAWNKKPVSIAPITDYVEDLGMAISFKTVDHSSNTIHFNVSTTEKDWIVLKAIEKPLINVLWIGTLVLVLGLFIAIIRRYTEFRKMRDKGVE